MKKVFVVAVLLLVFTFSLFAEDVPFDKVRVSESLILSEKEIQTIVDECTSQFSGMDLLHKIVDRLNALYLEKGYPNARAYVPEQNIENRTVVIELVEGRIGIITVSGNNYTSEYFILKSLRLDSNTVLDLAELENKLLSFNRWNSGVELKSTLNPGKAGNGTTDIDIQVNESVPFDGYFSFDNYASDASGNFRAGFHMALNSLTKNRDPFTAGVYMSHGSRSFYADYNFPAFGDMPRIETRFGIRTSYSSSEVPNGLFTMKSESFSGSVYIGALINRTPTSNINAILSSTYSSTSTGIDDIQFPTESIITGRLGASASFILDKFNISASVGASAGSQLTGRNQVDLYGKFDASFSVKITPDDISFTTLSASGQWMPFNDVIPNQEMLYAGGASSVRGYSEGVLWGKSGYIINAEFHMWLPGSKRSSAFLFADHAGIFPYPSDVRDNYLLGAGAGLDLYFDNSVHFKFTVGGPVITVDQGGKAPEFKANFSLTFSSPNKT